MRGRRVQGWPVPRPRAASAVGNPGNAASGRLLRGGPVSKIEALERHGRQSSALRRANPGKPGAQCHGPHARPRAHQDGRAAEGTPHAGPFAKSRGAGVCLPAPARNPTMCCRQQHAPRRPGCSVRCRLPTGAASPPGGRARAAGHRYRRVSRTATARACRSADTRWGVGAARRGAQSAPGTRARPGGRRTRGSRHPHAGDAAPRALAPQREALGGRPGRCGAGASGPQGEARRDYRRPSRREAVRAAGRRARGECQSRAGVHAATGAGRPAGAASNTSRRASSRRP